MTGSVEGAGVVRLVAVEADADMAADVGVELEVVTAVPAVVAGVGVWLVDEASACFCG